MRRLSSIAVVAAAVLFAACSSSSATTAPATSGASQPASSAPAESASTAPSEMASASASTAVESAAPSVDVSAFGSKYAEISTKLEAAVKAFSAKIAADPTQMLSAYKDLTAAYKEAITELKAVDWPAGVKSDMLQVLNDEDELVGILDKAALDPAALATSQSRMTELTTEIQTLGKKIAAYFGQPVQ